MAWVSESRSAFGRGNSSQGEPLEIPPHALPGLLKSPPKRVRRCKLAILLFVLSIVALLIVGPPRTVTAGEDYVGVVSVDGPIDAVSAAYVARAIDEASAERARLIVIILDTPGGLLSATREIVEAILAARIPVAVYVAPPGARAASAGTFITVSANFAAMALGTNIGAASPVTASGQDIPETLARKINEDTRAFIRSIAEARNRNVHALEETVSKARSYSAKTAVELNVVDLIATDLSNLLDQLDGRETETAQGLVVLQTRDANIQEIEPTLSESFLGVLARPNIAFLLLVIGGLGILIEFLTPGFLGPGVVGAIALALAYVGVGNLPVSWVGVGLVLGSMVLFYLELLEPGLGIFGVGGVISLVLGALLLFGGYIGPTDILEFGFRVSLWLVVLAPGTVAVFVLLLMYSVRTTGGSPTGHISAARAALVGQRGVALTKLAPSGRVRLADRDWTATTGPDDLIQEGDEVSVVGVYGDVLKVARGKEEGHSEENH